MDRILDPRGLSSWERLWLRINGIDIRKCTICPKRGVFSFSKKEGRWGSWRTYNACDDHLRWLETVIKLWKRRVSETAKPTPGGSVTRNKG